MVDAPEHQELVAQGDILEEEVSSGFRPDKNKAERRDQPIDHAVQDSQERPATLASACRTVFLPTTAIGKPATCAVGPACLDYYRDKID